MAAVVLEEIQVLLCGDFGVGSFCEAKSIF